MQNITLKQTIIVGILFSFIYLIRPSDTKNNIDPKTLNLLEKYLINIDSQGEKIVIFIGTGPMYYKEEIINFYDKVPIEEFHRRLKEENYTVVTLASPCTKKCTDEYTQLALLINNIKPEALVFKGVHSDIGLENLNRIVKKEKIPLFLFGTELVIDYNLYVGPDNQQLGSKAAEGLKPLIKPNQKALYIETTRIGGEDKLDNGYERINKARVLLTKQGVKESKTIFTEWSEDKTYQQIYSFLQTGERVDYIIAPSVETARGAASALEALQIKTTKIVCLDLTEEAVQLLQTDRIYAAVSQNLINQGFLVAESIINKKYNDTYKNKILTIGDFITKETLPDHLIQGNEYKW